MTGIGELAEGPLHAALKVELADPGSRFEVPLGRWVIDVVRSDGELVEIQTGGFGPLGPKIDGLLDSHRMRIVHPVPSRRWVVRMDPDGRELSRRRSPRSTGALEVFHQLVAFPTLIGHPHLVLEVLELEEDHVRGVAPIRTGRRTRDPGVRHLVQVLQRYEIHTPDDVLTLLGKPLPTDDFTTADLAGHLRVPTMLSQRIVYCLRHLDLIGQVGRRGRAPLYRGGRG